MTTTPATGQSFFGLDTRVLSDRLWQFRRSVSKRVLLIEFGDSSLTIAEARYTGIDIEYKHFNRILLPANAIERGVPSDPEKMASLIQSICIEEHIYAHRAAVVLPPEIAFSQLIDIPAELTIAQAWDYVNDPSSGLQIPIPLQQTDYDIVPVDPPLALSKGHKFKPYLLNSVPKKLVDQLLDTLQKADLELQVLDLGFTSQLRLIADQIFALQTAEYCLMLELLAQCTHLTVVTASGPVAVQRMSAIREFPEPDLTKDRTDGDAVIIDYGSAEAITLADEKYLRISELDLRVLVKQVREYTKVFAAKAPNYCCTKIYLSGVNSAHPTLAELLGSALDIPVEIIRPLGASGVGNVSFAKALLHQSLGRIVGLGLSQLPNDYMEDLSFTENVNQKSTLEASTPQSEAPIAIQERGREEVEQEVKEEDTELLIGKLVIGQENSAVEQEGESIGDLEAEEWPSIQKDLLAVEGEKVGGITEGAEKVIAADGVRNESDEKSESNSFLLGELRLSMEGDQPTTEQHQKIESNGVESSSSVDISVDLHSPREPDVEEETRGKEKNLLGELRFKSEDD